MISLAVPSVWEARKPAVLHQAPLPDRAVVNGRIGQEAGQRCVITRPWRLPQTRPWPVVQSAWRAHPGGTQDARGDGKAAWGLEFVLLFYLLHLDTFVLFCISSIMNMIL